MTHDDLHRSSFIVSTHLNPKQITARDRETRVICTSTALWKGDRI